MSVASAAFTASCGLKIVREGEKTSAHGLSLPVIISASSIADTIEEVIPHLLKPVATYMVGVRFEYLPI